MNTARTGSVVAGKYRLTHILGEGAMGVVWAAINEATERQVALKLISHTLAGNVEGRARLVREARACGRISHRNVVEIYDAGETDDGDPFLVMPLLVGETLAARIERTHFLAQSVAARVGLEIARGLAAAHTAGIIHRDLKPGNIFLVRESDADDDAVKLLDFGVSKILVAQDAVATATGSALGSPAYMSPEQARGVRDIDHRTDLWALGVVLFEMLTGTRPFVGDSPYTVVADILTGQIPDVRERLPSIDTRLAVVISSCLERDVSKRVGSATEIANVLRSLLGAPSADASGPLPPVASLPTTHVRFAPSVTSTTPVLGNTFVQPPRRAQFPVIAGIALGAFALVATTVTVVALNQSHDAVTEVHLHTTTSTAPSPSISTTTQPPTVIETTTVIDLTTSEASSAVPAQSSMAPHNATHLLDKNPTHTTPTTTKSSAPRATARLPTDPG